MNAMVLYQPQSSLQYIDIPEPTCGNDQVKVRVLACAVCRTDLHIVDGELTDPVLPLIPGHEIVGEIIEVGSSVHALSSGMRVGIPWLGWTCGECAFCRSGEENLCDQARFTGYHLNGGYAEYAVADARYCFPLSSSRDPVKDAPLLCAGLIGYRSYRMTGNAHRLGLYGFGAAAHILAQIALQEGREVYAFTRPDDDETRSFALSLGVHWAGHSGQQPPHPMDAAIIFAPVGSLVPHALQHTRKGGSVICAGIHMSDIPSFPYSLIWGERALRSVANLTRTDGYEFFKKISEYPVHISAQSFLLQEANRALELLRKGKLQGTAVLVP